MTMNRLGRHFHDLMLLRAVIEQGGINRAAKEVAITQPALTRSIARLESTLGVKLLHRSAKGIVPTTAGEALMTHIRALAAELDHAMLTLDTLRDGVGGLVSCGVTMAPLAKVVSEAIDRLQATRPQGRVRVVDGSPFALLASLRIGELDLVVTLKSMDSPDEMDLIEEVIGIDEAAIFVRRGHPVAGRTDLNLARLTETQQWIVPAPGDEQHRAVTNQFRSLHVPMPLNTVETVGFGLMREMLLTTDRLVLLTSDSVTDLLRDEAIVRLSGNWRFPATRTVMCRRSSTTLSALATALADQLRDAARAHLSQARETG